MDYKAVITGDIVDSSKTIKYRERVLNAINGTCELFSNWINSYEIFRGDCFQILMARAEMAAKLALLIRCALKSNSPKDDPIKLDARLSIGIGTIEFYSDTLSTSDGEAFRLSGRGLEALKKRRLAVHTPWEEFNEGITVSTSFVDTLVTSWTIDRAHLMLKYLSSNNKKGVEESLGESQQNVSKKLIRTQAENVDLYLEYFKTQVEKLTRE